MSYQEILKRGLKRARVGVGPGLRAALRRRVTLDRRNSEGFR